VSASQPCNAVQVDISAMLDGELDEARVRRVLVHIEICPQCRSFMQRLRGQIELHREAWRLDAAPGKQEAGQQEDPLDVSALSGVGGRALPSPLEEDPFAGDLFEDLDEELFWGEEQEAELARLIEDGRERLAEVLYQLGRAYVLLTVNPAFFRILSKEPVPIPEFRLRGRAILDGVSGGQDAPLDEDGQPMAGFAEARELLDGRLDSEQDNLEKGRKLLEEALLLDPGRIPARIMLGHYYWQKLELDYAARLFRDVWRRTHALGEQEPRDPSTGVPLRCYALEHLGNIYIAEDLQYMALRIFRMLVDSGVMQIHANFSSCLLNLSYTCLQIGADEQGLQALLRLYRDFPSKRSEMGQIIGLRPDFLTLLDQESFAERLARACPEWFGPDAELLKHGQKLSFQFLSKGGDAR
jgi:tetratricopeptide (TPR) repeat protein